MTKNEVLELLNHNEKYPYSRYLHPGKILLLEMKKNDMTIYFSVSKNRHIGGIIRVSHNISGICKERTQKTSLKLLQML